MDAEDIATEAGAVVAQLMERDTKLSQEVGRAWSDIMLTESLSEPLKRLHHLIVWNEYVNS